MLSVNVKAKLAKGVLLSSICAAVFALAACGGGGGGGDTPSNSTMNGDGAVNTEAAFEGNERALALSTTVTKPGSRQSAARFLTQSTFGPTNADVDRIMSIGYEPWINEQFTLSPKVSYKTYWDQRNTLKAADVQQITHAFWANAISGQDQLRQRIALALSEIFVVSTTDGCGANNPRGVASYMDMLANNAFGSYRTLLESVALHPVMGCYLSHLRNQKEDVVTGRVPDENFAREVMQLFSIGLVQLNQDGTPKLGSNGQPLETYSASDVAGLAKVFTGWSWACPDWPSDTCFRSGVRGRDGVADPERWSISMKPYARFHSTSEKRFLGTVIPAQSTANPEESLRIALNTLTSHPNVGPFIGKQLIQRLVTSNPSPAYVRRVALAFTNSGGSMKAMILQILMDSEARDVAPAYASNTYGKVREPILRMTALMRAYGASSATGSFLMWSTNEPSYGLGQSILQSPSVFNYFRPGYIPPGSSTARASLVAPEMQIMHETSVAGYVNYIRDFLFAGVGSRGYDNNGTSPDITLEFQRNTNSTLRTLSTNAAALVEDVNQKLMYGNMPAALKTEITDVVNSISVASTTQQGATDVAETARRRIMIAILLTMASPEFQVQK